MKNKWLVGISVLLIFGFILAGCATNADIDNGITPQPKTLTITGFPEPSVRTLAVIKIYDGADPWNKPVVASAGAAVRPESTDCTFSLHVGGDEWDNAAADWTGSGEYLIWLFIYRNDSWEPVGQQTMTEYGFVGGTNDIINYTFTDETPSITFSFSNDFKERWW